MKEIIDLEKNKGVYSLKATTSIYNLIKPSQDDFYNVDDMNVNMDIIEGELDKQSKQITVCNEEIEKVRGEIGTAIEGIDLSSVNAHTTSVGESIKAHITSIKDTIVGHVTSVVNAARDVVTNHITSQHTTTKGHVTTKGTEINNNTNSARDNINNYTLARTNEIKNSLGGMSNKCYIYSSNVIYQDLTEVNNVHAGVAKSYCKILKKFTAKYVGLITFSVDIKYTYTNQGNKLYIHYPNKSGASYSISGTGNYISVYDVVRGYPTMSVVDVGVVGGFAFGLFGASPAPPQSGAYFTVRLTIPVDIGDEIVIMSMVDNSTNICSVKNFKIMGSVVNI